MSGAPLDPAAAAALAAQLAQGALHLKAAKYFQVAGYTMMIFDHFLTFGEEVERIWKRRFSGATVLFLLNRYLTPLQFAMIINAFNNPGWSKETCDKYVSFEGYSTVGLVAVCEMIMILRIFALYNRNYYILAFLICCWFAQIAVGCYGLASGFAVPLPPGFVGCIFTGNPIFSALWWGPLITDAFIFMFTLWRTRKYFSTHGTAVPTIELFIRDGVMYFAVIFAANLLNILIYSIAKDADVKPIGASFSQLLTSVMISRLVLNLRSVGQPSVDGPTMVSQPVMKFSARVTRNTEDSLMTRTIGNLGAELETYYDNRTQKSQWESEPATTIELRSRGGV